MNPVAVAPDRYGAEVLKHFRAPHNAGSFPAGTAGLLTGRAGECRHGRAIELSLRVEGGRVAECRYRVYGCPATIALCSLLSDRVAGLMPEEARKLSLVALAEELKLAPEKRSAALLLEDALWSALAEYNMDIPKPNAVQGRAARESST